MERIRPTIPGEYWQEEPPAPSQARGKHRVGEAQPALEAGPWAAPDDLLGARSVAKRVRIGLVGAAVIGAVVGVTISVDSGYGMFAALPPIVLPPSVSEAPPAQALTPVPSTFESKARKPSPSTVAQPSRRAAPPSVTTVATPSAAPSVWTTLTVKATRVLNRGESVQTNRTRLLMQTDGDLVIIDEFGVTRWRSATAGPGDSAVFQNDGNFVVYDARMSSLWTSRTYGNNGAVLELRANGDVCIVSSGGAMVWSSGTAH
jgi:hypothetical protein